MQSKVTFYEVFTAILSQNKSTLAAILAPSSPLSCIIRLVEHHLACSECYQPMGSLDSGHVASCMSYFDSWASLSSPNLHKITKKKVRWPPFYKLKKKKYKVLIAMTPLSFTANLQIQ